MTFGRIYPYGGVGGGGGLFHIKLENIEHERRKKAYHVYSLAECVLLAL